MNFVEICRKLIAIDSSPASSTVEVADYLASLAKELGLFPEVIYEVQNGITQANIIVRLQEFRPGDAEFLLQAHLDTVDPGPFSLWTKNDFNPYDAVIDDGQIYGLGAAEVKLDFLCKLRALSQFKQRELKALKPVLIGTYGEETGMQGALRLIRKNKINAKYALIGEASDLNIIHAAKGFAVVEVRIPISEAEQQFKISRQISESNSTQTKLFSGQSAHSSTPHLGDNAVQKLLDFLVKQPDNTVIIEADGGTRFNMIPNQAMIETDTSTHLSDHSAIQLKKIYRALQEVESDMRKFIDPEFQPNHSTVSLGIIRSTEDSILLGGSCRILPNITQEQYENWMRKIQTVCEECGAQFRVTDYKKPFRTNQNSVLIKSAQSILNKMNIDSTCKTLASTNEASLFSRLNIECICIGAGGREGNVHTPQEHVRIEDLSRATEFYEQMIERFCV